MSLDLAFHYPYPSPDYSFVWHDEGRIEKRATGLQPKECEGRAPVLAVGSNRSPEQFSRKKARFNLCGTILVEPIILSDYDVVYGAGVASYGALGAMLQYVSGGRVQISLTWLDEKQLVAMDESESSAYQRRPLFLKEVIFPERAITPSPAFQTYHCLAGEWAGEDGTGFALSAIRSFSPLGQRARVTTRRVLCEVFFYGLHHAGRLMQSCRSFEKFVTLLIESPHFRDEIRAMLQEKTIPFIFPEDRLL